jgi:hypothetical protein
MNSAVKLSELEARVLGLEPDKHCGVTVTTPHGRAFSFGVSEDRARNMLETMAARKYNDVTVAMHQQKTARLESRPAQAR